MTSTRTLTSSSQTVTDTFRYDVWGDIAERTGNTPTPHQFMGALGYEREADSGLIFIGTRYYDPSVGRFISQDAAQYGVNWYVYAANNPVSGFDYAGQWWETALDIAGLILDVKDFIEEPSLGNAAWIIGDVASIILPTPTPSVIKHGDDVVKWIDDAFKHGDEAVNALRQGGNKLGFIDDWPEFYHGTYKDQVDNILNNGIDTGSHAIDFDPRIDPNFAQDVMEHFGRGDVDEFIPFRIPPDRVDEFLDDIGTYRGVSDLEIIKPIPPEWIGAPLPRPW